MLSATIITFNEERNLEDCILSLKEVADEIIVLDSGSTDKTVEIAIELGAIVHNQVFLGYGRQKNKATDFCKYEYVINLDADERLSKQLQHEILSVKRNGFEAGCYDMPRLNNYCGKWIKHGGWYPDRKKRIWSKFSWKWSENEVHEDLVRNAHDNSSVQSLSGDLIHYSFRTAEEHFAQIEKFTSIAAEALYQKGKTSNEVLPLIKASFRFMRDYLFKLGCLDGFIGWKIASRNAYAVFLRYRKLYLLQKK